MKGHKFGVIVKGIAEGGKAEALATFISGGQCQSLGHFG